MTEDTECQHGKENLSKSSGNILKLYPVYPKNTPDPKTNHKEDTSGSSNLVFTSQPHPHDAVVSNSDSTGSHYLEPDYSSLQLYKWV